MRCNSPRASAGLRILAASIAPPSAEPAPTSMCNSSMKAMILPCLVISRISAVSRSSNCPRYLVPATIAVISSITTRLSSRLSGTSSRTIRCARPSTIAVLPTPGSPSKTGLFLVRRLRIVTRRSVSRARPTTVSSSPSAALAVRSMLYLLSALPPRGIGRRFVSVRVLVPPRLSSRISSKWASRLRTIASVSAPISRSNTVARALFCFSRL